ncbi:MAG: TRAP transporter small permease subunit [Deltaproteobacteria bacterium]|nr:TRAP transporter small permease subunit [Deltaproteobacteria bacterium]
MKIGKLANSTKAAVDFLSRQMIWIPVAILFIMMIFTATDVIGRYVFNHPIKGSNDFVEIFLVPMVFLALSYTQLFKGHVQVVLVYTKFSKQKQRVLDMIMYILSSATFGLMAWNQGHYAWKILFSSNPGPRSMLLGIPHLPFIFMAAIGSLLLCLQLLVDSIDAINKMKGSNNGQ